MVEKSQPVWKEIFTSWPEKLPKRGVVISTLNEMTPFKGYMIKGETLLLERTNPDPAGARYVLMGFDAIHMLKLIDPLREDVFTAAGFIGQFAKM